MYQHTKLSIVDVLQDRKNVSIDFQLIPNARRGFENVLTWWPFGKLMTMSKKTTKTTKRFFTK